MSLSNENLKIAVFAGTAAERDYLRDCLINVPATVFCFEKETSIFDNLKSLLPRIVIAKTDSKDVVWRFIFAMHALDADGVLLIASDVLSVGQFDLNGLTIFIHCVSSNCNGIGLSEVIGRIIEELPPIKQMGHQHLLVGETEAIKHIRSMLPTLVKSIDTVLITGEAGTGKELLARLIVSDQYASFVKFDCAELMPQMIAHLREEENFLKTCRHSTNHEPSQTSAPLIFLLDKINQLHPQAQSEILLLLEGLFQNNDRKSEKTYSCVRFIATSEEDLEQLVHQGKFREDLFYRINVIPIFMPPLRHRIADIPLLIDYFIIDACARTHKSFIVPTENTRTNFCHYQWPGNLNELKRLMRRLVLSGDESCEISKHIFTDNNTKKPGNLWQSLAIDFQPNALELEKYLPANNNLSLKSISDTFVSRIEKELMKKALESTNWNRKKAAGLLNISYKSMLNKMKAYDII